MTDKELDDLFQKNFSGHQVPVPAGMWDRVNPQKDKRRRILLFWWSGLGVAALFIIAGTGNWLYHTSSEKKMIATTAAKSIHTQPASNSSKATTPFDQPSGSGKKDDLPNGLAEQQLELSPVLTNQQSSSQIAQPHNKTENQAADLYTHQNNHKTDTGATINKRQNAKSYAANSSRRNKQDNSIANFEPGNGEVYNNKNEISQALASTDSNTTIAAPNQSAVSVQKPDSNAILASNSTTQQAKAAAVKVKKIHGEKATSFELMIAGYGNSRNVYDATHFSSAGLVTSRALNQQEKVLMNSFSITARINKPLTKNISLKTGLQFLQTHQRVSYNYETVIPSFTVSSSSNDTTVSARLQSKQSVIKGTYNSLSIPVLVSYHTNGAKLSFGATAGVMVNVLSWYAGNVPNADNTQVVEAKKAFRTSTGASLYAGLTAAKQVGSFQLFAEPHIQYTLSSVTKSSASFRQKITSYGFGIGIRKTIGK